MGYQLTIEPLGATIDVEDGQTILDAALRQGIYLPHACGHGLCGTCKVQIEAGEVDHGNANPFALMDFEREEGRTLACCATLEADTVIQAEIDDEPDARIIPVQDYTATVTRVVDLTPTIRAVHLRLDRPMPYQAGQYLRLQVPGVDDARAFSMANAPQPDGAAQEVELNIRRVPGGQATSWLHDSLCEGDVLPVSGPYGRFFVRQSAQMPLLFMAGGSGLSSPRAMIQELLREGCRQPITLVYGQRTGEELYYDEAFRELARQHDNFEYLPVLSDEPPDSGWQGARGYVHEAAKARFEGDFSGRKAYLCGPPAMIEACITALMQGRLFERDIYTEKFFSAADAQGATRSALFRRI